MKVKYLILFLFIGIFSANAQDPNPELFQTWYLYYDVVDLEEPQYHYGEDVPQMTINEDFSFTAIDSCWDISGNFEYLEGDTGYDFFLDTINFEEDCTLGGSNGYILKLLYESPSPLGGYLFEDGNTKELYLEYGPGFGLGFRNQVTLSVPKQQRQEITIFPNPANDRISISGLQNPVDEVQVLNVTGSLIKSFNFKNGDFYDVSELNQGVYFLKITSAGTTSIKKLVKR